MSTNGSHTLDHDDWVHQTRVFLQPIAAPSILGLFAFAASTFIVAANLAGWYGTPESLRYVFPFTTAFGGVTQLAAAMWAFRARDGVATAMHGTSGLVLAGLRPAATARGDAHARAADRAVRALRLLVPRAGGDHRLRRDRRARREPRPVLGPARACGRRRVRRGVLPHRHPDLEDGRGLGTDRRRVDRHLRGRRADDRERLGPHGPAAGRASQGGERPGAPPDPHARLRARRAGRQAGAVERPWHRSTPKLTGARHWSAGSATWPRARPSWPAGGCGGRCCGGSVWCR